MSDTPFGDNCHRLWAAGLPAIPLMRHDVTLGDGTKAPGAGKRPIIPAWQVMQGRMPDETEQAQWSLMYRTANMGLPLGPQSGVVAIDIDTVDPTILGVLDRVLPPSPWRRVGAKGRVQLYKYDGEKIIRVKYRRADNGKMDNAVEMLGAGSQIVLPPSIHPTTGKPYYANRDIVEAINSGELRVLPPNFEAILRDALIQAGVPVNQSKGYGAVTDYVSTGHRDNTTVSLAGLFAGDVIRGRKTLKEAIAQIEVAVLQFMEKTYGDNVDPSKGPQKLLEFLIRDVTGPKGRPLPKGWDEGLSEEDREQWGLDQFTQDHVTWDQERIRSYFSALLEKPGVKDNPDLFREVARDVIGKIASNGTLDPLEEDSLVHLIADVSDRNMSVAAVRRQLQSLRRVTITGVSHGEIARSVLDELAERDGEIRFEFDLLWQWKGSHWVKMPEGDILKHIIEEYGHMKACVRASDHAGILKTMKNLSCKRLAQTPEAGINFVNGFLDEDLQLKPHNPDFGMTYCLTYAYLPENAGRCVKWQKMLADYWGKDADYGLKVQALGELIAMTLFSKMPDAEVAVCLYGLGQSGKSRVIEIVKSLMPESACTSIPPTVWGDKFAPAQLVGKLFNSAGELSENQRIDSARFKTIVSGQDTDAQHKGQQIFIFRPRAAHWFASNHTPKTQDSSDGFTRRWIFLTFPRKFPDALKILNYEKEVIAEEREYIAAWAVEYMKDLRANNYRLCDPPSSQDQREKLENELNSVRSFIVTLRDQGKLNLGVDYHKDLPQSYQITALDTLWTEYRSYCVANAVSPVGSRALLKRMEHLQGQFGFEMEKVPSSSGFPVEVYKYLTLARKDTVRALAAKIAS